jgi:hypothetical protein
MDDNCGSAETATLLQHHQTLFCQLRVELDVVIRVPDLQKTCLAQDANRLANRAKCVRAFAQWTGKTSQQARSASVV